MSLVTVEEVRALVATDVEDDTLQSIIDTQEAWLARRIGPLADERTEHFIYAGGSIILQLRRPTNGVEVEDNSEAIDDAYIELRSDGWRVARTLGTWLGPIDVTYTPNDEILVKDVIIQMVRLALIPVGTAPGDQESGIYESETIGEYSYRIAAGARTPEARRWALVNSLLAPRIPHSLKLLSSYSVDIRERSTAVLP